MVVEGAYSPCAGSGQDHFVIPDLIRDQPSSSFPRKRQTNQWHPDAPSGCASELDDPPRTLSHSFAKPTHSFGLPPRLVLLQRHRFTRREGCVDRDPRKP